LTSGEEGGDEEDEDEGEDLVTQLWRDDAVAKLSLSPMRKSFGSCSLTAFG